MQTERPTVMREYIRHPEETAQTLRRHAMPRDIEFRTELPKTLVGKVAYRQLEEEELAKRKKK